MLASLAELTEIALDAGLCAFGATSADPFPEVEATLLSRRADELHGGMQFTYRNPSRSTDPERSLPGARTLLVGAYDYQRELPDRPPAVQGRVAAYSWDDHYTVLRDALDQVAEPIRAAGFRAIVLADQNHLVDRAAAHRAGIGWWGKSSNVLVPGVGSLVVLGAVLTDADLAPVLPPAEVADGCQSCTQCLDHCPTGAIVGPGVVDARRCLSWLLQVEGPFPVAYREALGDRIYGCDDCQDVCPPNRLRRRAPSATGAAGAWVDIIEMLSLDDDELLDRYGRWYVPNRLPDYLRRNALVVLANIGSADAPEVVAIVETYLARPSPMLRAQAVWTARQLTIAIPPELADDPDPGVRMEVGRP